MSVTIGNATRFGHRPRGLVHVVGPEAADYLERMLSNEIRSLGVGESCAALLLTPKARVVAPLRVLRRGPDDFLLLTEPPLAERVRAELVRSRFAARAEIVAEERPTLLLLAPEPPEGAEAVRNDDYGVPAWELLDAEPPTEAVEIGDEELEVLRIRAATPAFGREIDDRVLPAEAGLVERAVSLTKGCYPGQEPIARLHYRGHANRGLRRLRLAAADLPAPDADVEFEGKTVGRVTSAARDGDEIVALAYVRVKVPPGATLRVAGAEARPLDD